MDTITDLLKIECVCSRHFGATCLFLSQPALRHYYYEYLWVWLALSTRNAKNSNPLHFDYIE